MSLRNWKTRIMLLWAALFVSGQLADSAAEAAPDVKLDLAPSVKLDLTSTDTPNPTPNKFIQDLDVHLDINKISKPFDYFQFINPIMTVRWESLIGANICTAPVVGEDGTIYVGTDNKKLYAIKTDGSIKWTISLGGNSYSAPAIGPDGSIYVNTWEDHKLVAITPGGKKKWEFVKGESKLAAKNVSPHSSPVVGADGTIYTGGSELDKKLYAVTPNGIKKWDFNTRGLVSTLAIGTDGTIYAGSRGAEGHLYAFNPNGTLKWKSTEVLDILSFSIGNNGTVYAGTQWNGLRAFKTDGDGSSKMVKTAEPLSPIVMLAVGTDGTIYVNNSQKTFVLKPDGTIKWTTNFQYINADPVKWTKWTIPNVTIGNDGKIYETEFEDKDKIHTYRKDLKHALVVRNADGLVIGRFSSDAPVSYPLAFGSDGTVYAAAGNKLFALGTVAASSVTLNKSKMNLQTGESEALIATVVPEGATNKRVMWSSSNDKVAAVDNMGIVTALAPGDAKITVVTEEGGFFASCIVTVKASTNLPEPKEPAENPPVQN